MSDNESVNMTGLKLKDIERYKNAERLARALKSYLTNDDHSPNPTTTTCTTSSVTSNQLVTSRGRNKDKRICQLNAAYKYCVHLENKIKDIYDKENQPVPDDLKLVHNVTNLNLSRFDISTDQIQHEQSNMFFHTPLNKNTSINDSSIVSSLTSTTGLTNSNNKRTKPNMNGLKNISPILGNKNHYLNDNEEDHESLDDLNTETKSARKRRLIDKSEELNTSTKRANMVDMNNNNLEMSDLNNCLLTPKTSMNNSRNSTNIEFRRHYFLRSTAMRLKNALSASSSTLNSKQSKNSKKLDGSVLSSSRSSSLTTTPVLRANGDVSSSASSSVSSLLDNLDHKQLLRVDMPQEELNNLFDLNSKDLNSKKNFNFV